MIKSRAHGSIRVHDGRGTLQYLTQNERVIRNVTFNLIPNDTLPNTGQNVPSALNPFLSHIKHARVVDPVLII